MHIQDLILLAISKESEDILIGRRYLQKKLYFISIAGQDNLRHQSMPFGPYSSWVTENLEVLIRAKFLKETRTSEPINTNIFKEKEIYSYELSSDWTEVYSEIIETPGYDYWISCIEAVNDHIISFDFNMLSIAAKAHWYLFSRGRAYTHELLNETIKWFGWDLTDEQISNIILFLDGITAHNKNNTKEKLKKV